MEVCNEDCFNCPHDDCIKNISSYSLYTESQKRYLKSEKGKAVAKRYRQSEKGKSARKRYQRSEKGRETQRRYYQRHREEILRKRKEARECESRKEAV